MIADILVFLAVVAFLVVVAGLVLLAIDRDARRDTRRPRRRQRGGRHRKLLVMAQ